jgi:Rho GTPase-activating protein 1
MRSQIASKLRNTSISAVPPPKTSSDYSFFLAEIAASILYQSPIPSRSGLPIYILSAAAFPDAREVEYDALLPYVLARLPGEDELLSGTSYEVIFFAGGSGDGVTTARRQRPGFGWVVQAYHVLSRALKKRLQNLYVVHERAWVRMLVETFSTIVSPKFRRKIHHGECAVFFMVFKPVPEVLLSISSKCCFALNPKHVAKCCYILTLSR